MEPLNEKWAVVSDFDDTITTFDIGDAITLHFGAADAVEVRNSYRPGVKVEEWMEEVFGRLNTGPGEIRKFVLKTSRLRAGFGSFLKLCGKKRIPFEIVSGGLDIYAKPLLKKWKIKGRPFFFGTARWLRSGGIKASYPFLKKCTLEDFKASRVKAFQKKGFKVIFFGDGTSDFKAADCADIVFSRRKLLLLCRKNKIRTKYLYDFTGAITYIREKVDGKR